MELTPCQSDDIGDSASNETDVAIAAEIATSRNSLAGINISGICQCCKTPIDPERLAFLSKDKIPHCLYCIKCQKEAEGGRRDREEMTYTVIEETNIEDAEIETK